MLSLKLAKKTYDMMKNDRIRAMSLAIAEKFGIRKDIVRLDTNNVCNIECIMCNNKLVKITPKCIMSFEDYKTVINKITRRTRFLYLSCSYEPLVTPNFGDYAEYAKKCCGGIPFVSLCTNGLLLSEKMIKQFVDNKIDEIIVSFNGFNKNDYERIMYRSDYNIVTRNLKRLNEYKANANSELPRIRLNSILLKSNIKNFEEVIRFIIEYNIDVVQFRELCVSETANNYSEVLEEELKNIPEDDFVKLVHQIKKDAIALSKMGKKIILPKSIMQSEDLAEKKMQTTKMTCAVPYFSYWIDHLGNVKSCPAGAAGSIICNLKSDNLQEHKKEIEAFRKKALKGKCLAACSSNIDSSDFL